MSDGFRPPGLRERIVDAVATVLVLYAALVILHLLGVVTLEFVPFAGP